MAKFLYDRGQHRRKHCWKNSYAGFQPSAKGQVGKCSSKITQTIAQALLDDGVPDWDNEDAQYPTAIYNVFEGIPYEAAPTEPGKSYHGYPWRGTMPLRIFAQLEERASQSGHGRRFKKWVRKHSEMHR